MDWQAQNRVERMAKIWEEHCKMFTVLLVIVQAAQVQYTLFKLLLFVIRQDKKHQLDVVFSLSIKTNCLTFIGGI